MEWLRALRSIGGVDWKQEQVAGLMEWLFYVGVVVAVLATAEDLWRRRVSNYVTAGAFVAGMALHAWLFGWGGVWQSLLGGVGGFLAFLIFFMLGGMGGGDVKLMAGFGAIVGGDHIVPAIVLVAMLGGLMAMGYLAFRKLRDLAKRDKDAAAEKPTRKAMIPYAPAISLGMLLTVWANWYPTFVE